MHQSTFNIVPHASTLREKDTVYGYGYGYGYG